MVKKIIINEIKEGERCPVCNKGCFDKCVENLSGEYIYLKCNNCGECVEP